MIPQIFLGQRYALGCSQRLAFFERDYLVYQYELHESLGHRTRTGVIVVAAVLFASVFSFFAQPSGPGLRH
jgi:hypothetical protein